MVAQKASLFILKLGDGGSPESFTAIGGMQQVAFSIRNQAVNSSNIEAGQWQVINDSAGLKSLSITGQGIFTDTVSEENFRNFAFNSSVKNYEISFANGHKITGAFFITDYSRIGNIEDEELFQMTLESAGNITYS